MITALLISHNQCTQLKQTLSTLHSHLSSINGHIIIADDASIDDTKDYITVHYPDITYMCNTYTEGYCATFNKALPFVTTPYIFVLDPSISTLSLSLSNILSYCQSLPKNLLTTLPLRTNASSLFWDHIKLHYTGTQCTISTSSPESAPLFFSEAMILDTLLTQSLPPLSTVYNSTFYAWLDFSFKGRQLGYNLSHYTHTNLHKLGPASSCFSHTYSLAEIQQDEWLFQWTHLTSFYFQWRRKLRLLSTWATFKPKLLWAWIQAVIYTSWRKPKLKSNWFILNDVEILLKKNQPPTTLASNTSYS